jgi:hypothetical protein
MRTLHQCLLDADLVRLRAIARFWDVELTASRHRDVAAELAEAMSSPEAVAAVKDALTDEQGRALESLLASGGRMPLKILTRDWGEIRPMGPGRMEREQPWRAPVSAAEGLWYRGFLHRGFDQGPDGAYEVAFVPSELLANLPVSSAYVPVITLAPVPEPIAVHSAGSMLLDDACTLLAYLQNEKVRPDPDGGWPAHHETSLLRQLWSPDPERLAFLRHLVRGLEWLRVTDAGRLRPDPGPVTAWLQNSLGRQRRALARAWQTDPLWNDLFHVPTLDPADTGAWRNDPLLARGAILHHLTACEPSSWYALDDFVDGIQESDPDFQRPGGDYASWYIRHATTGAYLSGFESWDEVEGALIRYIIAHPLAWLGLVDLDAGPIPAAFRLTSAGAAFLGMVSEECEPEPASLSLRPDFTVLVPCARRYERFQLARIADWVSSPTITAQGAESLFIYRLTPASLARARQQGIPIARVLEFLSSTIEFATPDASVPRFVEAALTRWDARGSEAQLECVVLLRLCSEELMAQAMSSPPIRRLIREQLGPTSASVHRSDWPRLVSLLGELGLLTDVIDLDE